MKNKKLEGNTIIAINSAKKIIEIFLGPFLTAYFIKTSVESVVDLSIYYIFSYILLAIGSFIVASIIKNKFRIGMFRIGVITTFFYIMTIIVLKEQVVNHLGLIAVLYSISQSCYWFPYNLFVTNKIDNNIRTEYTVKSKNVSKIVEILTPLLLGTAISATNYESTALIILGVSFIQIVLSFILTPENEEKLDKLNLKKTWNELKDNKQIRNMLKVEFYAGMNASDGALTVFLTIIIFNSFKTDMNLGIINSITAVLTMFFIYMFGKIYKRRDDNRIIILSSIIPVITIFSILLWRNNITILIYNVCYSLFVTVLILARDIRLFNIADSRIIDKNNQSEFFAIRECILNMGRVIGYSLLLIAGLSGNQLILNIMMVILTFSVFAMGINIRKIEKFEE